MSHEHERAEILEVNQATLGGVQSMREGDRQKREHQQATTSPPPSLSSIRNVQPSPKTTPTSVKSSLLYLVYVQFTELMLSTKRPQASQIAHEN